MQKEQKPKVIAIVGPTASGKTSLSIYLAQKLRGGPRKDATRPRGKPCKQPEPWSGEIISADSRQVYRGLDIGTGKVTKAEMAGVPHHLLDVVSPKTVYNASDFEHDARRAIDDVLGRGALPLIVGGTSFYVDTLLGRMIFPDVPPNEKLRAKLEKRSLEELLSQLEECDPERAKTIERGNKRRIIRALEIAETIGMSPRGGPSLNGACAYDVLWLGIDPGAEKLWENIHTRLLSRIEDGMVEEAVALHQKGLSYKRMEALGLEYRYLALLLQHKISKEQFVEQLELAIRHYAKRQRRWFGRNKDIHWVKNKSEALRLAQAFLR